MRQSEESILCLVGPNDVSGCTGILQLALADSFSHCVRSILMGVVVGVPKLKGLNSGSY